MGDLRQQLGAEELAAPSQEQAAAPQDILERHCQEEAVPSSAAALVPEIPSSWSPIAGSQESSIQALQADSPDGSPQFVGLEPSPSASMQERFKLWQPQRRHGHGGGSSIGRMELPPRPACDASSPEVEAAKTYEQAARTALLRLGWRSRVSSQDGRLPEDRRQTIVVG